MTSSRASLVSCEMSDKDILQCVETQSNYKNAPGTVLKQRLEYVQKVLGEPLYYVMMEGTKLDWRLQKHFLSPLALKHHVQAVLTAIGYVKMPVRESSVESWQRLLHFAQARCTSLKQCFETYFTGCTAATAQTIDGYVNHLMNMCAALNINHFLDVLTNPQQYRAVLAQKCQSAYTESTYITALLSAFKHNQHLKMKHAEAYIMWARASSEHRAKHMKASRLNAPTHARQSENFVSMDEMRQKLSELSSGEDPHATRKQSLSLLVLMYACCMPPKRAEVGTVRIFQTEPEPHLKGLYPNYIVMDQSMMFITQHKTSKHEVHSTGIQERLPDEFMAALRMSLDRWPRDHLFVDDKGQGYGRKGFSKWVRRTTERLFEGRAPGVNLLRHSFCTDLDYNKLTCAERDNIALRSGHSATMQDQYRFLSLTCVSCKGESSINI